MKRLSTFILSTLTILLQSAEVRISQGRFDDFTCFIIENETLIVKAVPHINRIVSLERKDFPGNILWFNKSTQYPGWINYGGSKVWPGPQSDWIYDFPPIPELDQLPGKGFISEQGTLLMITPPCLQYGTRFTREIALDGNRVILRESLTNISERPIYRTIWEVSQYITNGIITIGGVFDPKALRQYHNQLIDDPRCSVRGIEIIAHPEQRYTKIIHPPSATFVEYRVNGLRLTRYSDTASHTESYIGNGYVELESVSSLDKLAPAETRTFTHIWILEREN